MQKHIKVVSLNPSSNVLKVHSFAVYANIFFYKLGQTYKSFMNIQKNKNNAQSWHKIFVTLISWFYVCTPKQRKALKRAKKSTQKAKKQNTCNATKL